MTVCWGPAACKSRASACILMVFFFNDTATTEIYTLSLHDALPIYPYGEHDFGAVRVQGHTVLFKIDSYEDRKSGSAGMPRPISYAVFCLKKTIHYTNTSYPRHDRTLSASTVLVIVSRSLRDLASLRLSPVRRPPPSTPLPPTTPPPPPPRRPPPHPTFLPPQQTPR